MRRSLVLAIAVSACSTTTTSIDDDVARIGRLAQATKLELPKDVTQAEIDPETGDEVRALLEKPLDAETAVRIALLNNRELRGTLRDLGIERGQLVQAGLLPNPLVQFDIRAPGGAQPVQQDYYVEYELTRALLTPKRTGIAEAELDAARYRVAGAVIDQAYETRVAFYELQAAQQRFTIAQRNLDALAAARDAAQALFDAGNVAAVDLANQIAAFESARARTGELELEVLEHREEMQTILGLSGPETDWTTAGELAALPDGNGVPTDLEKQVITASLDLVQTKRRLEAIGKRTGLAKTTGWLPEIVVDAHVERDLIFWERGAGASIRLPVFDRNQGLVASYQAEFDGLMERYHGLGINLRSAARRARNRVLSAYTRARQYDATIVPARDKVLEQTMLQYNAMQVGIFQLLTARTQQLDTELARIETLREFWSARAALDALLAGHAPETLRGH